MAARPQSRRDGTPRNRLGFWCGLAILVLLAAYLGVLEYSRPSPTGDELTLGAYLELAEQGRVADARILDADGIVVGTYERDDGTAAPYHLRYFQSESLRETLAEILLTNRVPFTIDQQFAKNLVLPATLLLPALILVVIFVYLILSYRGGSGLFGITSGARKVEPDETSVTFADVAGQDDAVAELRELSAFLADPARFAAVGAAIPKGVLLYGPPGCGKTLMARALAGEAGAAFYSISGSDFVELYAGVGASRVRELFKQAREHAPAIVFIDELDSVGRRRTTGTASGASMRDEQEQALNQILAEMDGFSPSAGIIVLGATNRPDTLDPALLRPGRFDRTIGLERADEAGRLAILEVHARDKPLDPDVDLAAVARRAIGLTGADLASVTNEAALLAARAAKTVIGQGELDAALARILEAPERQRRLSLRERGIGRRSVGGPDRATFADVAGVDDALAELAEISDFLAHPERFTEIGARVPRGVLLTGPPGCGKTLLARAVAGEANAAFFSASAPEFVEVFVGQGATRVRDLFADAAAAAPAILFIDEIDAVGARRGADVGSSTEREQTLNQILVALDGFEERAAVIVIAATNRPDILDPALVRPGRFDRHVAVSLPDRAGRAEILALHAAGTRLAPDIDLDAVAGLTPGFSGADLANVLNEAALLAARRGGTVVTRAGIDEAIERAMLGVSSRRTVLSAAERTTVAYHEAGHALVARWLPSARVPHKLSLMAGHQSLGFTWHADGAEPSVHSRSGLVEEMSTLLGGRVAEQLVLGEPGTAGADDLTRATAIAERMVTTLGMAAGLSPRSYATGRAPSAQTAQRIDTAVDALVDEAHEQAGAVLAGARAALDRVAEALLAHETLTAAQFEALVADPASAPGPASAEPRPAG